MKIFVPATSGEFTTDAGISPRLLTNLADRIRSGLFPHGASSRNQYQVVRHEEGALQFRSTSMWTGVNVGLNDVTLKTDEHSGTVRFEIRYWTWAKYAVALCATIGGLGALLFTFGRAFMPDQWFRDFDKSPALAWSMVVFWGLIWPWILIAFHKPFARKCLINILNEVNE